MEFKNKKTWTYKAIVINKFVLFVKIVKWSLKHVSTICFGLNDWTLIRSTHEMSTLVT